MCCSLIIQCGQLIPGFKNTLPSHNIMEDGSLRPCPSRWFCLPSTLAEWWELISEEPEGWEVKGIECPEFIVLSVDKEQRQMSEKRVPTISTSHHQWERNYETEYWWETVFLKQTQYSFFSCYALDTKKLILLPTDSFIHSVATQKGVTGTQPLASRRAIELERNLATHVTNALQTWLPFDPTC